MEEKKNLKNGTAAVNQGHKELPGGLLWLQCRKCTSLQKSNDLCGKADIDLGLKVHFGEMLRPARLAPAASFTTFKLA